MCLDSLYMLFEKLAFLHRVCLCLLILSTCWEIGMLAYVLLLSFSSIHIRLFEKLACLHRSCCCPLILSTCAEKLASLHMAGYCPLILSIFLRNWQVCTGLVIVLWFCPHVWEFNMFAQGWLLPFDSVHMFENLACLHRVGYCPFSFLGWRSVLVDAGVRVGGGAVGGLSAPGYHMHRSGQVQSSAYIVHVCTVCTNQCPYI